MGKNKKNFRPSHHPFQRKSPPRMLPLARSGFSKFKQSKYKSPVPDDYKKVAKAVAAVQLQNVDLASMINPHKKYTKELFQLATTVINQTQAVDYLLKKFKILQENSFLDKWMAKVLVTELLWGKQFLKSSSNPIEAMKYYEEDLRESFIEVTSLFPHPENTKITYVVPTYIRVNTLAISVEETIQAFINEGGRLLPRSYTYPDHLKVLAGLKGNCFMRDYHIPELLIFPPGSLFYEHPSYLKKLFLLQDKGSCLSSFLFNPEPGSSVLDICAAPGLKTNHLANIMKNNGHIYANDIHPERADSLRNMMELTQVKCVEFLKMDYLAINEESHKNVDYILVDLTSTQSGIFSKKAKHGQATRLTRMRFRLSMALRSSLQTFPRVKRVVYTACSVFPEECEQVVGDALREVGDSFTLVDLKEKLGSGWRSYGGIEYPFSDKCIRTVPQNDMCQGHFIAVFERNFDIPVPPYEKRIKSRPKKQNQDEEDDVDADFYGDD